jgi:TetR/AcrR family transcriptional regulator, cholesterol catabolism regulator
MVSRRVTAPRDPARRRRILDAAKRHFSMYGFKGTNLDAIAAEAGCAKGALYLEFADKRALLREVVDETLAAVAARYAKEVMSIPSPLERLASTLRFAFRETATEPIFPKLLREDPDLRVLGLAGNADVAREAKAQVDVLASWVKEGIAKGEIRPDVDSEAIPFVIGVLRFAPQHLGLVTQLGLFSAERVLEGIVEVFRDGLAAKGAVKAKSKRRERKGKP